MQAPVKWIVPALFVAVGVPLILADAASTSRQLDALDSTERREAACRANAEEAGLSDVPGMCRCIVREAQERGATDAWGAYDDAKLRPIIASCQRAQVWR